MLSYALAIAVAFSSLVLFSTAFVMSDIHRKDDFLWSGVGLFYALILWFCARNITGTVLLGQTAASILLVSFCWQTLKLRKAIANPEKAAEIDNFSVVRSMNGLFRRKKVKPQVEQPTPVTETLEKVKESEIVIPEEVSPEAKTDLPNQEKETPEDLDAVKESKEIEINENEVNENEANPETETAVEPVAEKQEMETTAETPEVSETIGSEDDSSDENEPEASSTAEEDTSFLPTAIPQTSTTEPEKSDDLAQNIDIKEPETERESLAPETQSELDDSAIETDEKQSVPPREEAQTKESSLDSLETVEVAEVLEADPQQNIPGNESSDRHNIIEVQTTEIETTAQSSNSNSEEVDK